MYDDPRIDPEMRAVSLARDEAAAAAGIVPGPPWDPQRAANDAVALPAAAGGPEMASSEDRWVAARGRRVLCRVHRPRAGAALPAVVYFHGGGWVWSSVDTHDRVARELAAGGGAAVVSVDYALSPEARFPQALEECAAVVRRIAADAAAWGVDPGRIALAGDSAGANLALASALVLRDGGGPALRGILAFYPVCAADFATPSYREFAAGYGLTADAMRMYWDLYAPDEASRLSPFAAPLRAELRGLPPVLVQLAELDVLRSEGAALAERLRAADVAVEAQVMPGLLHGYIRATGSVARAREAADEAGAWLRRVLADQRPGQRPE